MNQFHANEIQFVGNLVIARRGSDSFSTFVETAAVDGCNTTYRNDGVWQLSFLAGSRHLSNGVEIDEARLMPFFDELVPRALKWDESWEEIFNELVSQGVSLGDKSRKELAQEMIRHGVSVIERREVSIDPIVSVCNGLRVLHRSGCTVHMVTGAPEPMATAMINRVGMDQVFSQVRGPQSYARGKPEPDPFAPYGNREGVVAFEDAPNGGRSALLAGVRVVILALENEKRRREWDAMVRELPRREDQTVITTHSWDNLSID